MNRLFFGLVAMLAITIGLLVGTLNSDKVMLDLLWIQLEWPLGLLILLAFAVGLLLGLLLAYLTHLIPLRLKIRKLQAEAARSEGRGAADTDA